MIKDLNKLRDEVYNDSFTHGFWNNVRGLNELFELISDEVEEAKVEYEEGNLKTYYKGRDKKPEGLPSELSDIIIFVLDQCGFEKIDLENEEKEEKCTSSYDLGTHEAWKEIYTKNGDPFEVMKTNIERSMGLAIINKGIFEKSHGSYLKDVIGHVIELSSELGIDIENELKLKIAHNKTRPIKRKEVGDNKLFDEIAEEKLADEIARHGNGAYKYIPEVLKKRREEEEKAINRRKIWEESNSSREDDEER